MAGAAGQPALARLHQAQTAEQIGCGHQPGHRRFSCGHRCPGTAAAATGLGGAASAEPAGRPPRRDRPGGAIAGAYRPDRVHGRRCGGGLWRPAAGALLGSRPLAGTAQPPRRHPAGIATRFLCHPKGSGWPARTVLLPTATGRWHRRSNRAGVRERESPAAASRHHRLPGRLGPGGSDRATGPKPAAAATAANLPRTR